MQSCIKLSAGVRAPRPVSRAKPVARRATLSVRAYKDDGNKGDVKTSEKAKGKVSQEKQVEELLERLKSQGIGKQRAKELLQTWASLGARDPEEIKKLLVKRSKQPLRAIGIQALLDTGVAAFGFYSGHLTGQSDFTGSILVSLTAYFFACYYALQAFSGLSTVVGIYAASRKYDTDGEALAVAVQQLAGPSSGNPVVDKAAVAMNTLELFRTLDSIFDTLKVMQKEGKLERSMLDNLSAYLTLQRAQEVYGFQPEKYGLSQDEAAEIAGVFAMFDANDNGLLEASELRQICVQLGTNLNEAELQAALKALDVEKIGKVRFNDWVAWWVGKGRPSPLSSVN